MIRKTTLICIAIWIMGASASCDRLGLASGKDENDESLLALIATGSGGTTNTDSGINPAVPTVAYDSSSYSIVRNVAVSNITPELGGDSPTSCYALPGLPEGLSIDPVSCVISGTPRSVQDSASYVITATNAYGSGQTTVELEIKSPGIYIETTITTLSEDGTGSQNVSLNTPPNGNVVIHISSFDTTELQLSNDGGVSANAYVNLTFTPTDWSTVQTVTLVGQNDTILDGNKSVVVTSSIDASTTDTTGYATVASNNTLITVTDVPTAGTQIVYSGYDGFDVFNVVYVPPKTFPRGIDDMGNSGTITVTSPATVSNGYLIGETEVTYGLWNAVKLWGATHGYSLSGNQGSIAGGGSTGQFPVSSVSWRSAMVWCNALTEYINEANGTSLTPVYYTDSSYTLLQKNASLTPTCNAVDLTPGSCDNPFVRPDANGFRLPTAKEWELAARYVVDVDNDGVLSVPDTEYNLGSRVSGYMGAGHPINYAVYAATGPAPVKSKLPNALGIYDMSGNVAEWNFDLVVASRIYHGGAYDNTLSWLPNAAISTISSDTFHPTIGFRVARTQ